MSALGAALRLPTVESGVQFVKIRANALDLKR